MSHKIPNLAQVSKGQSGPSHPAWKGGQSKDNTRLYHKIYNQRLRISVLQALGAKCNRCGFSDPRALQIDHVSGFGSKERKERLFSGNFHKHVLQSFLVKENKYQLLCANCNWIKRSENDERNKK